MMKLSILILVFILAGCVHLTDMTNLDPSYYPKKVRSGDIVDKFIYEETHLIKSPMYVGIFGKEY